MIKVLTWIVALLLDTCNHRPDVEGDGLDGGVLVAPLIHVPQYSVHEAIELLVHDISPSCFDGFGRFDVRHRVRPVQHLR